ncbi:hypothetical protein CYMTET_38389 [Cymbomonas tetramitiformis]|uniref:Uncharacterized protein n=1 Tax=Cymbomonas tetramitiformis TaxID=36881 RepID=A0AAE0CC37_9CHLO|nr:hypothetical protein CYMTET_38389 [Cymbomonas tetramitiformis]
MRKYFQLAQNKMATVRWFQLHLHGSTIAARLAPSNIQWWIKSYLPATNTSDTPNTPVTPTKRRGRAKALLEASSVYKRLVSTVKVHLAAGLPGNAHVIAGLIRSVLKEEAPEALSSRFDVSLSYTYAFLHSNDLVSRRATTNRKEPLDWEFQWERQILRLAHVVKTYNIPPALIIGFDHSGFQVLPLKSTTWAPSGADVVPLIGLDDKRQITGVIVEALGDNFEGLVVGFQAIYQGNTARCLPALEHRTKDLFDDFIYEFTYNHWADEETNISLFEKVIVKHLEGVKTRLRLVADQRAVVLLDAWPVQNTESFRGRVKRSWPWIILLYIFPGGTGKSQKFDVDGANVMKPKLHDRATKYIEKEFTRQLKSGVNAVDIRLDLTLGTLKVQQLYWLGEVYYEFKTNVPARTAGWVKTKVPLAFTAEWQDRAIEWQMAGKLWPGNSVEVVPAADELEPSPTDDDLGNMTFTDAAEAAAAGLVAREVETCRDTFDSLGGADIVKSKEGRRG